MVILELEQLIDTETLNLLKEKQEQAVIDKMTTVDLSKVILKPIKEIEKMAYELIKESIGRTQNTKKYYYLTENKYNGSIYETENELLVEVEERHKKIFIKSNEVSHIFSQHGKGWFYGVSGEYENEKITKKRIEEVTKIILNDWLQHFDEAIKLP